MFQKKIALILILTIALININRVEGAICGDTNTYTGCATCDVQGGKCLACTNSNQKVSLNGKKCVDTCEGSSTPSANNICSCTTSPKLQINSDSSDCVQCTDYISVDTKYCNTECPSKEYKPKDTNNKQCVSTCPKYAEDGISCLDQADPCTNKYVVDTKKCVATCPTDSTESNNECTCANFWKNDYSACGATCLALGQYQSEDANSKVCVLVASCQNAIDDTNQKCLATCPEGKKRDIDNKCQTTCKTNNADDTQTPGICKCKTGKYLNADKSDCIDSCKGVNQFLDGGICVADCPSSTGSLKYQKPDSTQCVTQCDSPFQPKNGKCTCPADPNCICPKSKPYWNHPTDKFECTDTCTGTNNKINLTGEKCVQDCETDSTASNNNQQKLQCQCSAPKLLINKDKNGCTDKCADSTEVLNFAENACLLNADCKTLFGTTTDTVYTTSTDTKYCICKTGYLASDKQSCVKSCNTLNEVQSFYPKRPSCQKYDQCTSVNGYIRSNALVSNQPSCQCTLDKSIKNSQQTSCVQSCSVNAEYKSLLLDVCQAKTTGGNCPFVDESNKLCKCGDGTNTNTDVSKVQRDTCQTLAQCTLPNQLNPNKDKCFSNCQSAIPKFKENICQYFPTSGSGSSALDDLCDFTGATNNIRNGKNDGCWCGKSQNNENQYIRADLTCNTSCENGKVINFLQRKCETHDANKYDLTDDQKFQKCKSSDFINYEGDGCMSTCPLKSLKQDKCVKVCDQGIPALDSNGNKLDYCTCPQGYFQFNDLSNTKFLRCVQQCPVAKKADNTFGQFVIDITSKSCISSCPSDQQLNDPFNDKCVCKTSTYYSTSTSNCVSCQKTLNNDNTKIYFINLLEDQCLNLPSAGFSCPVGQTVIKISTTPEIIKCGCQDGYFLNITEDACVNYCPSDLGQIYNQELKGCVIANCDLFQKKINGGLDKTKCLLCADGYGVKDDVCVSNTSTGNVQYCRQYYKTNDATPVYKCLNCYCDFALNSSGTQCISNQVYGVQGCHQYDEQNICKVCKATFFGNYQPLNNPTNQNYAQNYIIVDLGLRNSGYQNQGFNKECVDNTDDGKVIACKEYNDDKQTCKKCHQDMTPFQVKQVSYCLKRKFYNPNYCNKFKFTDGTDGDDKTGKTIDYNWCKCNSDLKYINYPQPFKVDSRLDTTDLYFQYPYDMENFPQQTQPFNGCVKIIDYCLLYDISPWMQPPKSDGTDQDVILCMKCQFGKLLTIDRKACVSSQSIFCNYAANDDTAYTTLNNCHASTTSCQTGLNYITVTGIDDKFNYQCGSINYCQTQATTTSSNLNVYTLDTCSACYNYYKLYTLSSKTICVYYKQQSSSLGFSNNSKCNTQLGFSETPVTSNQQTTCQCTTNNQQLTYDQTFPGISYSPQTTPVSTTQIRAPVNTGTCRAQPDTLCEDPYDAVVTNQVGKCKKCKATNWRSAAWNCLPNTLQQNQTFENCEEIITGYGQLWCNQCKKGYGIIMTAILQSDSTKTAFSKNGQCDKDLDNTQVIQDCIKYDIDDNAKPTSTLTCKRCRDGYKLDTNSCKMEEDFGCDFFYKFYTSSDDTKGNGKCECNSGFYQIYSEYKYSASTATDLIRPATCTATLQPNCYEYKKTTDTIIDNTKCMKCVTGQTGDGITCAKPPNDALAVSGSFDKCITFYGKLIVQYTNDNATPATIDQVYDFQWESDSKPCKLLTSTNNILNGVLFCAKYQDATTCSKCKYGFQEYKNSDQQIIKCVPKIKGCLIFQTFNAGQGNEVNKCLRCYPTFTEVFINGQSDEEKGIYCDDPNDQFILVEDASDSSIQYDIEPHPGCLKVQKTIEIDYKQYPNQPIYEASPADFYTRNCKVCREPYHLAYIGKKFIDNSKNLQQKIGCVLNNIEHCFSYIIDTTKANFGQCGQCYQPFRLWKNPTDGTYYCIQEGCVTPTITTVNNQVSVNIASCEICDNTTVDRPYYKSGNLCKRHSTYINKCIKYSDTTDGKCLKCDEANYFYYNNVQCIECRQDANKYYNSNENQNDCVNWSTNPLKCGTQYQNNRCKTCIANSDYQVRTYPIYASTSTNGVRDIAFCIDASNNCAEGHVIDGNQNYVCDRCFSQTETGVTQYYYGFVTDQNPKSCLNNESYIKYCQYYQDGSTSICKQCIQIVKEANKIDSYYGLVFDSNNKFIECKLSDESTAFCNKWLGTLKANSQNQYDYVCQSCDQRYSQYIRDNKCLKGCKVQYARKYCAQCHDGFSLVYSSSFSEQCLWNYDSQINVANQKRIKYCAQYSITISDNTNDITQSSGTANPQCQKCRDGYVLITQKDSVNVNVRCAKQYGSCKLDGCFMLHDSFVSKKVDGNENLYSNAEMLRCEGKLDYTDKASQAVYDSAANNQYGTKLKNTIYARNQFGCLMNYTDPVSKQVKQYSFNKYTKKCDFYLYNDGDSVTSQPNDGSQSNFGTTDLNSKGTEYDGGIAPPVATPVTPSSSSSTTPIVSSSSAQQSSGSMVAFQLLQILVLCSLIITFF